MSPEPDSRHLNPRGERRAVLMLLLACVLWGMSFHWSKEAQHLLGQRAAWASHGAVPESIGPAAFLTVRFLAASVVWGLVFPRALRGWSRSTVRAGVVGGVLLATGMLLQHYGLAKTSESLSAFLTSLTVLFTPLTASLLLGHRVGRGLWICVGCATIGVALMTLHREEGRFDVGAILGLLCAVVFSAHILWVDAVGRSESPWRFTLSQFVTATLVFGAFTLLQPGGGKLAWPSVAWKAIYSIEFGLLLSLTVVLATLVCFGLMFTYQPRTTPTRAALTYLSEAIFATVFAWLVAGRSISAVAVAGALLILLANVLAEWPTRKPIVTEPSMGMA